MLDLAALIPSAASHSGGERVILAGPYDVSKYLVRKLAAEGVIAGYIAHRVGDFPEDDPLVAGWWIDHRDGLWFIRSRVATTLLFVSAAPEQDLTGRMLLEARLKGVRRILLADAHGVIAREIDVSDALTTRLDSARPSRRLGEFTYKEAFNELYGLVGDRLRLSPETFVPDRIMLIPGSLSPGGAERQAAYTASGLASLYGRNVHIGCNHLAPPADFFKPVLERAGVDIHVVPGSSPEYDDEGIIEVRNQLSRYDALSFENIFHAIFHYALAIREVRPALVHTWMDYSNVLAGIAAELVGVPTLVLSGRSVAPDNFEVFQPYMRPGYLSLFERRMPLFLNNSRAGALDYQRWLGLPGTAFDVLHNGFEFPAGPPATSPEVTRRELGFPKDAVVIGSILRFSEEKRPELFIETARLLAARHPQARFVVYGAGRMLEAMRGLVSELGLSAAIKLPGITADAWSALAAMDVFVLTSRMEGLANVLVEAQASGVPVVCTGVGGMPETYIEGETGVGVPDATAEALADAVTLLVADPERRRRMSAKARDHARNEFDIDHMIANTLEAYRTARDLDAAQHDRRQDP